MRNISLRAFALSLLNFFHPCDFFLGALSSVYILDSVVSSDMFSFFNRKKRQILWVMWVSLTELTLTQITELR
jgi:hypothetical protein